MKSLRFVWIASVCAGFCATVCVAQQPSVPATPASAAAGSQTSAEDAKKAENVVRQRSKDYYAALVRGDRTTARQFVAPESVAQFDRMDTRSVISVTTTNIEVAPTGDTAIVNTNRTFAPPYAIAIAWKDTWKNVDGQWLLTFPAPRQAADNPFGIKASPNAPTQEQMVQQQKFATETVDPDQAFKAMQKMQAQEMQKRKAAEAAENAEEQRKAAAAAAAQQSKDSKSKKKVKKDASKTDASKTKQNSLTSPSTSPKPE